MHLYVVYTKNTDSGTPQYGPQQLLLSVYYV